MSRIFQLTLQVMLLILFFILVSIGRIQLWMGLFVLGIIATTSFGRIYCGWICPINTAMTFIAWLKIKLHIKSNKTPKILLNLWVKYIALAVFFTAFLISFVSGAKLPVLPILFSLGVIIAIFYPPDLWHHNLCPFGTILSLPAKLSRHFMRIEQDKCNNCGLCYQVCPAMSVKRLDDSHQIIKSECLVCMECSRKCKKNAITYQ